MLLHSYAAAGRLMALKFISTMSASADVLALASVEVDISNIAEGQVRPGCRTTATTGGPLALIDLITS